MTWIPLGFLGISVASLMVQSIALTRIVTGGSGPAHRGLRRTALCRVGTAVAYVTLGVVALAAEAATTALVALVVAGLVQGTWQVNAVADVVLRRSLDGVGRPTQGKEARIVLSKILKWALIAKLIGWLRRRREPPTPGATDPEEKGQ